MAIPLNENTVGTGVMERLSVATEINKAKARDVEKCAWVGKSLCDQLVVLVNNAENLAKAEVRQGVPEWQVIAHHTIKKTLRRVASKVHSKIDGKGICDRETSLVPKGCKGQPFTVLEATIYLAAVLVERAFTRTYCSTVWVSSEELEELEALPADERNARAMELAKDRKAEKISLGKIISEDYSLQIFIKPNLGDMTIRQQTTAPVDVEALADEIFI